MQPAQLQGLNRRPCCALPLVMLQVCSTARVTASCAGASAGLGGVLQVVDCAFGSSALAVHLLRVQVVSQCCPAGPALPQAIIAVLLVVYHR